MFNASEIQNKLQLVADGKLSVDAFEDWFVPASWSIRSDSGAELLALVASVHSLFSLRDDGAFDGRGLRRELGELIAPAKQNGWMSANVPIIVSVRFDPDPQPYNVDAHSSQDVHWSNPALAEL